MDQLHSLYEARRYKRRSVPSIAEIVGELTSLRGLAAKRGPEHLDAVWRQAVGDLTAKYTRTGPLRRGTLEILVANSILLQELAGFQKAALLDKVRELMGTNQIRDLRFRLDGSL